MDETKNSKIQLDEKSLDAIAGFFLLLISWEANEDQETNFISDSSC